MPLFQWLNHVNVETASKGFMSRPTIKSSSENQGRTVFYAVEIDTAGAGRADLTSLAA